MKTKIKRGKTIFIDGLYYTDVKLKVQYLSAQYYGEIGYPYSLEVERFILNYNETGDFFDIKQIDEMFGDEFLFLFDNYHKGRLENVKTKYRIYSKRTIDLINERFSVIGGDKGDCITDMVFAILTGSITVDFSEWSDSVNFLFTGDDLVQFPYDPDSDKSKELFNRVKMMMRQQKINNLIEKAKR